VAETVVHTGRRKTNSSYETAAPTRSSGGTIMVRSRRPISKRFLPT
jgi:hypothetical protein